VLWVLLFVLWLAALAGWIAMLRDVNRRPEWAFEHVGRSKGVTTTLIFFGGWIGAAYYFLAILPTLQEGETRGPTGPSRSDDDDWVPPTR
jgi:hypothetical protein